MQGQMAVSDLPFDFRIIGLRLSFSLLGGCEEQFFLCEHYLSFSSLSTACLFTQLIIYKSENVTLRSNKV